MASSTCRPRSRRKRTSPKCASPRMQQADAAPALRVARVSKAYGHVNALIDVSMEVDAGEIVGLVGDNGAGKSTLVQIIAGAHRPDEGAVFVGGEEVQFQSPLDAREHGIETV